MSGFSPAREWQALNEWTLRPLSLSAFLPKQKSPPKITPWCDDHLPQVSYISPKQGQKGRIILLTPAGCSSKCNQMKTGDMSVTNAPKYHDSTNYRIKLNGRLDRKWSDWFDQMEISTEGDQTILTGPVADQAALHGSLIRIRDLNLTLLSVEQTGPDQEDRK